MEPVPPSWCPGWPARDFRRSQWKIKIITNRCQYVRCSYPPPFSRCCELWRVWVPSGLFVPFSLYQIKSISDQKVPDPRFLLLLPLLLTEKYPTHSRPQNPLHVTPTQDHSIFGQSSPTSCWKPSLTALKAKRVGQILLKTLVGNPCFPSLLFVRGTRFYSPTTPPHPHPHPAPPPQDALVALPVRLCPLMPRKGDVGF